jgi:hypothetical protein
VNFRLTSISIQILVKILNMEVLQKLINLDQIWIDDNVGNVCSHAVNEIMEQILSTLFLNFFTFNVNSA